MVTLPARFNLIMSIISAVVRYTEVKWDDVGVWLLMAALELSAI